MRALVIGAGILASTLLWEGAEAQLLHPGAPASLAGPSAGIDPPRVDYDWVIRPLGEAPTTLGEYRGRVLFVNAWASWCVPCVREMAGIERLARALSDTDVAFLLVAVEGERAVRRHLRRHPMALPVFLEEERFPPAFGVRGIPMSWIVDREGRIVLHRFGAAAWDSPAVEAFLRELSGG